MQITLKKVCLTMLLVLSPLSVQADDPNLRLFGTLLIPSPCVIEDNNMIDVFFGDNVGVNRVDGVNYTQPVNYTLKCEPNISGNDLKLSIEGPKSDFDEAALQTNINDLAIRMTRNGEPFTINERFVITPDNPPAIQAVPVKRPGSALPQGAFEVIATLVADYQ